MGLFVPSCWHQGRWRGVGGSVLPKAQSCTVKSLVGEETMDPPPQGQLRWFSLCVFEVLMSIWDIRTFPNEENGLPLQSLESFHWDLFVYWLWREFVSALSSPNYVRWDVVVLQAATMGWLILMSPSVITLKKNQALSGAASLSQNSDGSRLFMLKIWVKFGNAEVAKSPVMQGTAVGGHHPWEGQRGHLTPHTAVGCGLWWFMGLDLKGL